MFTESETRQLEDAIQAILEIVHRVDNVEGVIETPKRVAKMYKEIFSGYNKDPEEVLSKRFPLETAERDLVIVKDIPFHSMCEHHMMPFYGKVHIGYIPNNFVVGLSKFPRLVEIYSRRLQIQEQIGTQIAAALNRYIEPQGVAVVIEASHMCMSARGIKSHGASTTTSTMSGLFFTNTDLRAEFLGLLR